VTASLVSAGPSRAAARSATDLPISPDALDRRWVASWLACPGAPERDPGVFRFRKVLDLGGVPSRFVVHVSGDQRFVLFVNGRRVGSGPARGDLDFWRFETFDLAPYLAPGRNLLVALVWSFGTQAPGAQIGDRTGFVLQGDGPNERVADSDGSWQCAPEPGHEPWPEGMQALREQAHQYVVVGPGERLVAARYDWDWARLPEAAATSARWQPAVAYDHPSPRSISEGPGYALSPEGRLLVPDALPPMEYRDVPAGSVVRSTGVADASGFPVSALTIPAQTRASLLLDRHELTAAYPELAFSGGDGARVRLSYQEALVTDGFRKGHRDVIADKRMLGYSDELLPDGGSGRVFHPLWWRTWRYLQIDVETAAEPLVLESLKAHATGYPFSLGARVESGDSTLDRIFAVGWHTARLCAHETYLDCPYYEQYQYVGDTRIQALISYALTGDDRLARQAITAFERSRRAEGLTSSRFPAGAPQYIPPFSLLWIGMVRDFWMYRGDPAFVRAQLAGTRTVLAWFLERQLPSGLLGPLPWWDFVDWAPEFAFGVPPQETDGQSAPITLQLVSALREAAELEAALGDASRAQEYRRRARIAADAVARLCWDGERGLVADLPAKDRFSQQTNILAILADAIPADRQSAALDRVLAAGMPMLRQRPAAPGAPRLAQASYYFRFYLARALEKLGRGDEYLPQLEPWREMLALGLSTWAETPSDATRSDCHAWSAHPSYDLLTLVAGIHPASPGFASVRIEPHLGSLDRLAARMPHPRGVIEVSYQRVGSTLEATITLPAGLTGELVGRSTRQPLRSGRQKLSIPAPAVPAASQRVAPLLPAPVEGSAARP
jgi:alpha-L-rhamnosidase